VRRLSKREKRFILVLALLGVLAVVGFSMAPKESLTFEDVLAYYVNAFNGAEQITIRPAQGGAQPVTLTRDEDMGLFSQLAMLARYGSFSPAPSPYPPKYLLDVTLQDGSRIQDISVGHHLDAPKQPLRGQAWLIPGTPGEREPAPFMADAIDRYLNPDEGEKEEPKEKGESE
jgi:hypothetical protein